MKSSNWKQAACLAFGFSVVLAAQESRNLSQDNMIAGPASKAVYDSWLTTLNNWKRDQKVRIGYAGAEYDRPELKWTQSSFIQAQMMIHDRYFFDPVTMKYTVDRFLADLEHRYGGLDAVLVWQSYPNLGIDNRNQYDMIRDMPGGVAGVREMVETFHRHGVKVFFPVMVWDSGTRDEGSPDWIAAAKLMAD